jgi:hypothetical protein
VINSRYVTTCDGGRPAVDHLGWVDQRPRRHFRAARAGPIKVDSELPALIDVSDALFIQALPGRFLHIGQT